MKLCCPPSSSILAYQGPPDSCCIYCNCSFNRDANLSAKPSQGLTPRDMKTMCLWSGDRLMLALCWIVERKFDVMQGWDGERERGGKNRIKILKQETYTHKHNDRMEKKEYLANDRIHRGKYTFITKSSSYDPDIPKALRERASMEFGMLLWERLKAIQIRPLQLSDPAFSLRDVCSCWLSSRLSSLFLPVLRQSAIFLYKWQKSPQK